MARQQQLELICHLTSAFLKDFDPEEHDAMVAKMFDDDYYAGAGAAEDEKLPGLANHLRKWACGSDRRSQYSSHAKTSFCHFVKLFMLKIQSFLWPTIASSGPPPLPMDGIAAAVLEELTADQDNWDEWDGVKVQEGEEEGDEDPGGGMAFDLGCLRLL